MVIFDIINNCRAVGRYIMLPAVLTKQPVIFLCNYICAKRDFQHFIEAQGPNHPDYRPVILYVGEFCRKTRGDDRIYRPVSLQQDLHLLTGVDKHLRILAANSDAVSAGNAPFGNNLRLAVEYPDGLNRALPDTSIAYAASIFYRVYQLYVFFRSCHFY